MYGVYDGSIMIAKDNFDGIENKSFVRLNKFCFFVTLRVSGVLCMSKLAHASNLKEHDDNDDFQGSAGRTVERG